MTGVRLLFRLAGGLVETHAKEGSLLAAHIQRLGIASPEFGDCGFNLDCGTCLIQFESPIETPPDLEESTFLRNMGYTDASFRCSCQLVVTQSLANSIISFPF